MNYELKKYDVTAVDIKGDGSTDYTCSVLSHPTGDTYDFNRGDTTIVNVTGAGTKTQDAIKAEIDTAVAAFVAATYPNT